MFRSTALVLLILIGVTTSAQALTLEANVFSFTDHDQLTMNSQEHEIMTSIYGTSIGGTWWYKMTRSARWGLNYFVGVGRAHTSNAKNDFTFAQSYLPVYLAQMAASYRFTTINNLIQTGVYIPVMARYVAYQEPTIDSQFKNKTKFIYGAGIDLGWNLSNQVYFVQRLQFSVDRQVLPIWMASLEWNL